MTKPGKVSTEDGIFEYLIGLADLAALIADRVFYGPLPEDELLPAVTFQMIDADPWISHSGPSGTKTNRYQFDIWVEPDQANIMFEIFTILQNAFSGYSGGMGSRQVQKTMIERAVTLNEPNTDRLRRSLDVVVTDAY